MKTIRISVSLFVLLIAGQLNVESQEPAKTVTGTGKPVATNRDTSFSNENVTILYRMTFSAPELTFEPENVGVNLLNSSRNYLEILNMQASSDGSNKGYQGYNEKIYGYVMPYPFSVRMVGTKGRSLYSPEVNFYNLSVSKRRPPSTHRSEFYNNPVYRVFGEVFNASMQTKYRLRNK